MGMASVWCDNCGASTDFDKNKTKEKVIEAWNIRYNKEKQAMSTKRSIKKFAISNESRLSLFVPLPSVVFDFDRGRRGFGVALGWLFFAMEIEYLGNKEKPL